MTFAIFGRLNILNKISIFGKGVEVPITKYFIYFLYSFIFYLSFTIKIVDHKPGSEGYRFTT